MPSAIHHEVPIEQKGKRIFINSLERHKDLSHLLGRIEHLFRNPDTREVVLYFRQRFRPFPNILAPLAGALEKIRNDGRAARVLLDFPELLETNCLSPQVFDPEVDQDPCGRVWRYSNSEEVQQLHRATIEYLTMNLIWEPGTLLAFEWSLYEIMDNVFQHAQTPSGYFMFQVQQSQRRLSYCVADQGLGILHSFATSKYRPATAPDAISLAVQKGVTRDPDVGMGNGLWGAAEIVARNEGQLTISSSGAALYFDRAARTVKTVDRVSVLNPTTPGTYIDIQLDASKSVQLSEMFDVFALPVNLRLEALENEDGAPVFKVKHFRFGTGTRSSGSFAYAHTANLLNETTGPVIVDFSNVGIVSSSFADEFIAKLFVSLNENQFNGRLRLHGMNSTVELIVRHAIAQRRARG